jgi:hypothetical protein
MIACVAVASQATPEVEQRKDVRIGQTPRLSMIWHRDPTTGNLEARWVAEPIETVWRGSLAPAA